MKAARSIVVRIALALVVFTCANIAPAPASPSDLEHARRLLADAILFDGHNDLPWAIRTDKKAPGDITAYDLRTRTAGQTDLPRLRQGGVSAQFWSVYIPGELSGGFARTQLEQIDLMRRVIERYPDALQLVGTAREVRAAKKAGRIASMLGIDIACSLARRTLECMARMGVSRMVTLGVVLVATAASACGGSGARLDAPVDQADAPIDCGVDRSDALLDLIDAIVVAARAGGGAGSNAVVVPSPADRDAFASTVVAALAGDNAAACALPPSYRLLRFASANLRVIAEVNAAGPAPARYWGTYAALSASASPSRLLAVEAPHPIFDTNTERQAADLFLQGRARFLLIAGAHRCANAPGSGCSGTTTACGSNEGYRISDAAHSDALPFFAVHAKLSQAPGALEFLQLHGNASQCPTALVSDSSGTWTDSSRAAALATALEAHAVGVGRCGAGFPQSGCSLCGTENVEARFTAGSPAACTQAGVNYGRLVHVEQLIELRRTPNAAAPGYQTFIDAALDAYPLDAALRR